uniref:Uncharacterized protein n=1 Tax=Glossina austeni TaxID=7395 RepID=A0A1A9VD45_GLOAU
MTTQKGLPTQVGMFGACSGVRLSTERSKIPFTSARDSRKLLLEYEPPPSLLCTQAFEYFRTINVFKAESIDLPKHEVGYVCIDVLSKIPTCLISCKSKGLLLCKQKATTTSDIRSIAAIAIKFLLTALIV